MLHEGDLVGGRFRLIRQIGSGGMASVWWARHELLARDVALKLSPLGRDEQIAARFVREAKIIGMFQHRNIVGVVDAGVLDEEGYAFLAMELLRGAPFADRLVHAHPLPAAEVVPILIEVCRGLEAAHAAGVVHRDMKPENIFLAVGPDEEVVPKIVDFGISQVAEALNEITVDGQLLGTPSYMAPEQARGERNIDARADLWAVGVILYEALSGRQPFRAEGHHAVLWRILEDQPAPLPPTVNPALRAVIARCLQKDRARRYRDAASLRADLEAALAGSTRCATTLPPPPPPGSVAALGRAALERLGKTFAGAGQLGAAIGTMPLAAIARSWTAIGFIGGVTAAAAIAAGTTRQAPVTVDATPAPEPPVLEVGIAAAAHGEIAAAEAGPEEAAPGEAAEAAPGVTARDVKAADSSPAPAAAAEETRPQPAARRRWYGPITRPGF